MEIRQKEEEYLDTSKHKLYGVADLGNLLLKEKEFRNYNNEIKVQKDIIKETKNRDRILSQTYDNGHVFDDLKRKIDRLASRKEENELTPVNYDKIESKLVNTKIDCLFYETILQNIGSKNKDVKKKPIKSKKKMSTYIEEKGEDDGRENEQDSLIIKYLNDNGVNRFDSNIKKKQNIGLEAYNIDDFMNFDSRCDINEVSVFSESFKHSKRNSRISRKRSSKKKSRSPLRLSPDSYKKSQFHSQSNQNTLRGKSKTKIAVNKESSGNQEKDTNIQASKDTDKPIEKKETTESQKATNKKANKLLCCFPSIS